jgi:hypothetical protein
VLGLSSRQVVSRPRVRPESRIDVEISAEADTAKISPLGNEWALPQFAGETRRLIA